jgi:4-amino-4-deoxy-L-arabinose transferase-like glycosyltransferase
MKKLLKWKWVFIIGVVILGLAFYLRIYNLTILPVFADEAIYIRWSQVMRAEPTLRFVPLSDGKQPLFMWLSIPFLKLFSDPVFAGRFTSVLAGMGTLLGIFLLSYSLFKSKKVALISSFFYALSPFSVFFDRMALVDPLLTMFGVWILLFGVLTARSLRNDLAMITGFLIGGGLLTKSPALFFVLLLPTTWLLSSWPKERRTFTSHLLKLVFLFFVSVAIGYGMYNILRLGPNFNMINLRNGDYIYPLNHFLTSPFDPLLPFFDRSFEWIGALGPAPILILALTGLLLGIKKYPKETTILFLWFLAPILVQSEFAKVFTSRYILFSLPYLFILGGSAFLIKKDLFNKLLTLALIIFVFLSVKNDYLFLTDPEKANLPRSERSGYLEEWTAGTGIKEVADFLITEYNKEPENTIVVGTEGFFGTLPDGLQIYLNSYPKIIVKGVGIPVAWVDTSLIESKEAGNPTYLVANSTRIWKEAEDQGLSLIAAYPKAAKPDGSREVLLFFEVTDETLETHQ